MAVTKDDKLKEALGKIATHLDMMRTHLGALGELAKTNSQINDSVVLVNSEVGAIETAVSDAQGALAK